MGDGNCKLCGETEEGSHHIITECEVMTACINDYQNTLSELHETIISKDEMAFGLVGDPIGEMSPKIILRNVITFIIRHVVFRNRHINFGGKEVAKLILKNKVREKIKKELINKWIEYRARNELDEFANKYLIENILGQIENNNFTINI